MLEFEETESWEYVLSLTFSQARNPEHKTEKVIYILSQDNESKFGCGMIAIVQSKLRKVIAIF